MGYGPAGTKNINEVEHNNRKLSIFSLIMFLKSQLLKRRNRELSLKN